ncbi:MAG: PadR family transcriptional regulator [Victivallales bacterium]|nr:PadR family transcriptional regulator [Victivallales bacterium]
MSESKELMHGSVEVVILRLLSEHDMYGYEMIKTVNERSNGYFQWREGSLYPCLHKLESDALVKSYSRESNGKTRRYYTLTSLGREAAKARTASTREFCAMLSMLLQPTPQA